MHNEEIRNLDELCELYWKNRHLLGDEEQRLFQGILLELQKGDQCDRINLERYLCRLGEKRRLMDENK
ncbi:MAG: hypothetical protein IJO94_04115 [Firmicutes bacterium]|nr:hypothetical protein [Bacillota bacterium]